MGGRRQKALKVPKLGRYERPGRKPLGRAVIDGKQCYFGEFGTAECEERYQKAIAEWLARGKRPAPPKPEQLPVARLAADYLRHATLYNRKGDRKTSELDGVRSALRPLLKLYSRCTVTEFDAPKLATVRDAMVRVPVDGEGNPTGRGLARTTINSHVLRIRRMFRWGVEQGLVPGTVLPGLEAVSGLRKGRSAARETEPRRPAPIEDVNDGSAGNRVDSNTGQ